MADRAAGPWPRRVPRAAAGLVVPVALVMALLMTGVTGCSGDVETPAAASSTASSQAAPSASAPALRGGESALQDLTIASCPSGAGRLEADGDLRNYSTTSADYVVTVTWLDSDGAIVDSAFTVVENLATRQQKSWKISATLDEPAASCTTRVSRGRI